MIYSTQLVGGGVCIHMVKAYSYVRFSSPEQEQGDSLRRQVEQAEKYAKEHDLTLDNSLMIDKGLSAYNGAHRYKGALGEFLRLVKEGKIPQGSVLIVENLDRLSREDVLDALNQFISLIEAGIKLVTLQDGQEYDKESISNNWAQLIISISYMARAHEESSTKSKRLKAAWQHKRELAYKNDQKLTTRTPYWIKLENGKFVLIPEICQAVKKIFELNLEGQGHERIAKLLNTDPHMWKPPKGKRNKTGGWRASYINKILNNRAVIGEFQPYVVKQDGEKRIREPIGEPIPDYFPAVIDKDLFYQVQAKIKANRERRGNAGGRTSKATNLFVHVIKCGLCGAPLNFVNKGKPPKGGQYLQCDNNRRFGNCPTKCIPYYKLEKIIFDNFEELDISKLLPNNNEVESQVNDLNNKLIAITQQLNESKNAVENLTDTIAKTKDHRVREQLENRLSKVFDKIEQLENECSKIQDEMSKLKMQKEELQEQIDNATRVYQLLNSAKDEEERINIRLKLRQIIQNTIEVIKVYPLLEPYKKFQEIEKPEEGMTLIKYMDNKYLDKITVKFKGGAFRILFFTGLFDPYDIDQD